MKKELDFYIDKYANEICSFLKKYGTCKRAELDKQIPVLKIRQNRLAYIMAYKMLENAGLIVIQRPFSVNFPLTDFETVFSVPPVK